MKIKAQLKYLRMSPRKIRLVADAVRGTDARNAAAILTHAPQRAAGPLRKLLKSAVAIGKQQLQLDEDAFVVKDLRVDPGPTLKRWRARAFGRAAVIRKRTSHISLVLETRSDVSPASRRHIREHKKALGVRR